MSRNIRPERSFESYSRGAELLKAIKAMWEDVKKIPYTNPERSDLINRNIRKLMEEFDLTFHEWYHWSEIAYGRVAKYTSSDSRDAVVKTVFVLWQKDGYGHALLCGVFDSEESLRAAAEKMELAPHMLLEYSTHKVGETIAPNDYTTTMLTLRLGS